MGSLASFSHDALYRTLPLGNALTARVLKIEPADSADEPSSLSCLMAVISLDPPPEYHAVSYVWGRSDLSHSLTVSINGIPLAVRPNIWKFLFQMQQQRFEGLLWVDALCINQNNLTERGHQVAMMGHIYQNAAIVHVWLGDNDEGTQFAMRRIATTDWGVVGRATMQGRREAWSDEDSASISQIWNCAYWARLWVVPEFVAAKEITIHCGSHQMAGELLETLVDNIGALSILPRDRRWEMPTEPSARLGLQIVKERLNRQRSQTLFAGDFAHLLSSLARGHCADSRDRIYAFLSFGVLEPDQLKPDYTKTVLQVFLDVCDAELGDYRHTRCFPRRGTGSWVTTLKHLRDVSAMLGLESEREELHFLFPQKRPRQGEAHAHV